MAFLSFLDEQSGITGSAWRKRLTPLSKFMDDTMRGESELSIAHRELLAVYISELNACQFCIGTHQYVAQRYGVKLELIDSLFGDIDKSSINPRLEPILNYVKKLTLKPSTVLIHDIEAIKSEGWNEKTIEDVVAITCAFNFYNRLVDGYRVKGTPRVYDFVGEYLSKKGYKIPWYIRYLLPKTRRKM